VVRHGDESVAKLSLPVLTPALDYDHPAVRRHAAEALGNLGPHARSAIPALRKALEDDDPVVRSSEDRRFRQVPRRHGHAFQTASGERRRA
jgi:hypothetical protein